MKILAKLSFVIIGMTSSQILEARDLTYKFGVGYSQMSIEQTAKGASNGADVQVNGVHLTYGIASDMQAGIYAGFHENFDVAVLGPTFRYDFQRLINRDSSAWTHLNLFAQVAFLAKIGKEMEKGISLHAPYLGFEILPFEKNNFAISTGAGLVIDMMDVNEFDFTSGQFGDISLRYYF